MVAPWNRTDHYIFALWFRLLFPRLLSAVGDWMSTILPHMVWPYCQFRMQVWKVLHTARLKCKTQKKHQKCDLWALTPNSAGLYLRNWGTYGQSEKRVKQRYVLQMSSQYDELRPTSGWDLLASLRHPCKFQRVSRIGSQVVGVSQTLRRWTEDVTYVRQGDRHIGHWKLFKLY